MKKNETPTLNGNHKIKTPIVAKYSRAYKRHLLRNELKERDIELQKQGYKANQALVPEKHLVKKQEPFVKHIKLDI